MNEAGIMILLVIIGVAGSFINVMAGGGSLITMGTMIALGIEPTVANGTNRLGILTAAISATRSFYKEGVINIRRSILFGLCTVPGSIAGALWASKIDNILFQKILGVIMLLVTITLFIPKKSGDNNRKSILIYPFLAVIGIYGGFIQAGVGILMMAAFRHLQKIPLTEVNVQKMVITLLFTIPALIVFAATGKINWKYAGAIALGNWIGAQLAVKLSVKKGDSVVKVTLSLVIILMAVKLLGIWK